MATHLIDFGPSGVYEAGAILIALLAYPDESGSEGQRADVHASLRAYALRARDEIEPGWANSLQLR